MCGERKNKTYLSSKFTLYGKLMTFLTQNDKVFKTPGENMGIYNKLHLCEIKWDIKLNKLIKNPSFKDFFDSLSWISIITLFYGVIYTYILRQPLVGRVILLIIAFFTFLPLIVLILFYQLNLILRHFQNFSKISSRSYFIMEITLVILALVFMWCIESSYGHYLLLYGIIVAVLILIIILIAKDKRKQICDLLKLLFIIAMAVIYFFAILTFINNYKTFPRNINSHSKHIVNSRNNEIIFSYTVTRESGIRY